MFRLLEELKLIDTIKISRRKNKNKNKNTEDETKGYFYIGKNLEYGIHIVKKINSVDELMDANINVIWKNIRIYNDKHNNYNLLYRNCGFIKGLDYILMIGLSPCDPYSYYDYGDFMGNLSYSSPMRRMNTRVEEKNTLNNKNISTNLLYKKFTDFESKYKTTIMDKNIIGIICGYFVDKYDIFMEIMHLKYNVSIKLVKYLITNYNIYCFQCHDSKKKYITQIDDTFCMTNEIGMPNLSLHDNIKNTEYCTCDDINTCEINQCKLKNPIIKKLREHKIYNRRQDSECPDEIKYGEKHGHNIYKCLMQCPETCNLNYIIRINLLLYIIYDVECRRSNFRVKQFNLDDMTFYKSKNIRNFKINLDGINYKISIN